MPVRRAPPAVHADARATAADTRLRAGRASAAGSKTKTAVPALFADWKRGVLAATARDAARSELWPEVEQALAQAQSYRAGGTLLSDDEAEEVADGFFAQQAPRVAKLENKHLASFGASAAQKDRVIHQVVDDARPRIEQRRDPFTPVALKDPQARAREVVLWENADVMVLVDLFVARPKALVVPKGAVAFPSDAPPGMLEELARIAAHVSDAFMSIRAGGAAAKPAGIWVNPPQHLTVKQLHVHVMPELPAWTELLGITGAGRVRAVELARDPQARPAMNAIFQQLTAALTNTLGPAT